MPVINTDWRNQNEYTHYPFADGSTLAKNTDREIPQNLLVDAYLHPIGGSAGQYLSSIAYDDGSVIMTISDSTGELASGEFEPNSSDLSDVVPLYDSFGRPAGTLVGSLPAMKALGGFTEGDRLYTIGETEFAPVTVVPTPAIGVRGFSLETGEFFAGDFWLVGENGVYFTLQDGRIRVDIVGDPTARQKFCEELDSYRQPWFLRSINSIGPSSFGDFKILSGNNLATDTALRIEPGEGRLTLTIAGKSLHAPA